MTVLNGFDSYMLCKFLAGLFHTSVDNVYWSLTFITPAVALIAYTVRYLITRSKSNVSE